MKKLLLLFLFSALGVAAAAQDRIVMRNADVIDGKVIRSGGSRIEYTKPGNSAGRVYTLSTADVSVVIYGDGRKEEFRVDAPKPERVMARLRNDYPRYQGEVAVGYALGVGTFACKNSHLTVETVHGVRLSPYVFLGLGAGLNYFYEMPESIMGGVSTVDDTGAVSVFANVKGYYPATKSTSLYFSAEVGGAFGVWGDLKEQRGVMVSAGPGVTLGSGKNRMVCDLSVRYQYIHQNINAVVFRVGFGF